MTEFRYTQAIQHSLWTHGKDETDSAGQRTENIKQLRERLQVSGVAVLSNAELLSIVFGTGSSTPGVIREVQTFIASMSLQELLTIDFGELSKSTCSAMRKQRNCKQF